MELGDVLLDAGFDEPYIGRSGDPLVDSVSATLTAVNFVASFGANAITILVGISELPTLGEGIIDWLRRRGGGTAELKTTVHIEGRRMDLAVKISGSPSESDAQALKAFSDAVSDWLDS